MDVQRDGLTIMRPLQSPSVRKRFDLNRSLSASPLQLVHPFSGQLLLTSDTTLYPQNQNRATARVEVARIRFQTLFVGNPSGWTQKERRSRDFRLVEGINEAN